MGVGVSSGQSAAAGRPALPFPSRGRRQSIIVRGRSAGAAPDPTHPPSPAGRRCSRDDCQWRHKSGTTTPGNVSRDVSGAPFSRERAGISGGAVSGYGTQPAGPEQPPGWHQAVTAPRDGPASPAGGQLGAGTVFALAAPAHASHATIGRAIGAAAPTRPPLFRRSETAHQSTHLGP